MSPKRGKDEANQSTASTQFNNMFTLHTASKGLVAPRSLEQGCSCSKPHLPAPALPSMLLLSMM